MKVQIKAKIKKFLTEISKVKENPYLKIGFYQLNLIKGLLRTLYKTKYRKLLIPIGFLLLLKMNNTYNVRYSFKQIKKEETMKKPLNQALILEKKEIIESEIDNIYKQHSKYNELDFSDQRLYIINQLNNIKILLNKTFILKRQKEKYEIVNNFIVKDEEKTKIKIKYEEVVDILKSIINNHIMRKRNDIDLIYYQIDILYKLRSNLNQEINIKIKEIEMFCNVQLGSRSYFHTNLKEFANLYCDIENDIKEYNQLSNELIKKKKEAYLNRNIINSYTKIFDKVNIYTYIRLANQPNRNQKIKEYKHIMMDLYNILKILHPRDISKKAKEEIVPHIEKTHLKIVDKYILFNLHLLIQNIKKAYEIDNKFDFEQKKIVMKEIKNMRKVLDIFQVNYISELLLLIEQNLHYNDRNLFLLWNHFKISYFENEMRRQKEKDVVEKKSEKTIKSMMNEINNFFTRLDRRLNLNNDYIYTIESCIFKKDYKKLYELLSKFDNTIYKDNEIYQKIKKDCYCLYLNSRYINLCDEYMDSLIKFDLNEYYKV